MQDSIEYEDKIMEVVEDITEVEDYEDIEI